jgi:hypothetical protein
MCLSIQRQMLKTIRSLSRIRARGMQWYLNRYANRLTTGLEIKSEPYRLGGEETLPCLGSVRPIPSMKRFQTGK